jgi:hypothetical protein
MTTLAVDKPRPYEAGNGHPAYNEIPAIASDIIYAGAAVGESSSTGTGRPLVAGDNFMGFCIENCDNSAGAAAAKMIKVLKRGVAWLTVTNGDNINDYGDTVYASDDDTFTMASTSNTAIGKLMRYDSATAKSLVEFEALAARSI